MSFLFWRRKQRDEELDEEIQSHLNMAARDRVERGESSEQAKQSARHELGNVALVKETTRDIWGWRWLTEFAQDVRYGMRTLYRSPGFVAVAALTLALGVGANLAIFQLIDTVLLKPLPVAQPEQLFFIENVGVQGGGGAPPYPCFETFRSNTHFFSGIAAYSPSGMKISIDGQIEQVEGQFASGNYFSLLGVRTFIGRPFGPADDSVIGIGGADGPVAVIGYNYWRRRFAGSPAVIGKKIQVGTTGVTIIGVTPSEFFGMVPGQDVDISLPMSLADPKLLSDRGSWWFDAVGRLKHGASKEQARAELDGFFQAFMDERTAMRGLRKDYFDHIELAAAGLGAEGLRTESVKPLMTLMAVVGCVLLIVCANVANLMLVRSAARRKEFAVRLAMGAGRLRLIRQMITEGMLLTGFGGLIGLFLASWGSSWLVSFFSIGRRQILLNLEPDGRLILFALGLLFITAIIFSFGPAWRSAQIDPGPVLKGSTTAASTRSSRLQVGKLLVVIQVTLSVVLLVGAGLFLRSLQNLKHLDAGFRPDGVLIMNVDADARNYGKRQMNDFWQETLTRAEAIPGVSSATLSRLSPVDGHDDGAMIEVPGFIPRADRDKTVSVNQISPEYFATMGIAILRGRAFNERDNESAPKVALLNETAARFYFGSHDPVGAELHISAPRTADPYEIVGVVKDSRHTSLRDEVPRLLYLPALQSNHPLPRLTLAIRTAGNPSGLAAPIRSAIHEQGADVLLTNVVTLNEQVNKSLWQERLVSSLSSIFGLLALLLACVGLYGVISYTVARRTKEIGIRIALGATRVNVLRMVLKESLALVFVGVAIGVPGAFAATRFISTMLYGVSASDPLTIAGAALVMGAVTVPAALIPARRATKVDPLIAIRYE